MTTTNVHGHDETTVVARAYPNIALMKYWGKVDDDLHIPTTSSVSMTLDICPTTTSVTLAESQGGADEVYLDNLSAPAEFAARVGRFLDLVRQRAEDDRRAIVDTHNEIPTGAGLASSAAGFAALATSAAEAYGLRLSPTELSRLARRGSGSAARSIFGGFAIWHRPPTPTTDPDELDRVSHAEPLNWAALDMAMVIVGVDTGAKSLSSRAAMARTVCTSALYHSWVASSHTDLRAMLAAADADDLATVGELAEANAMGMHATMLGARPPIRYLTAGSLEVLDHVIGLRNAGIPVHATADAGPNVKIICRRADAQAVAAGVRREFPSHLCLIAHPGPGAELLTAESRR